MLGLSVPVALLQLACMTLLPESPRWLLARHRPTEVLALLPLLAFHMSWCSFQGCLQPRPWQP